MMIKNENLVLKGRHLIAQGNPGKTGSRPGLVKVFENRPREKVFQREFFCSDEMDQLFFMVHYAIPFRPKGIICSVHRILADGFDTASFTQGGVSDRSSRNSTLGYDILALQAGNANLLYPIFYAFRIQKH